MKKSVEIELDSKFIAKVLLDLLILQKINAPIGAYVLLFLTIFGVSVAFNKEVK